MRPITGQARSVRLLGIGFIAVFASATHAATYYVDDSVGTSGSGTSWSSPKKTIQEALPLATQPNDEIHVAQGLYKPASQSTSIYLATEIRIKGGYAGYGATPDPDARDPILYITILSGDISGDDNPSDPFNALLTDDNAYHVVNATDVTPPSGTLANGANLDGVTITGGHASASGTLNSFGAGIYMEGSSAVFRGCIITFNNALTGGGGVFSDTGVDPVFRNCEITNNLGGKLGGGIYMEDYGRFLNCEISANEASTGGGVYGDSIDLAKFINVRFSANLNTGSILFGSDGAGMRLGAASTGDVEITNCQFDNNNAGDGTGGGLMFIGGDLDMTNCTFTLNTAVVGGGMVHDSNESSTAVNCIFWANIGTTSDPEIYDFGSASVTHSDVDGGWTGTGNIDVDPEFISTNNFRLRCTSDAVNAGSNGAVPCDEFDINEDGNDCDSPAQSTPDYDRKKRIANTTVDMGAFERISCEGDANADGQVDIDDLVLVIISWGATSGPADIHPNQCAGNNTVDIDDLVRVITLWGSCDDAMPYEGGGIPTTFQECWDDCSEVSREGTPGWHECMDACILGLCELGYTQYCP